LQNVISFGLFLVAFDTLALASQPLNRSLRALTFSQVHLCIGLFFCAFSFSTFQQASASFLFFLVSCIPAGIGLLLRSFSFSTSQQASASFLFFLVSCISAGIDLLFRSFSFITSQQASASFLFFLVSCISAGMGALDSRVLTTLESRFPCVRYVA
jgi:magnesium-transporting ATPase (P-type)